MGKNKKLGLVMEGGSMRGMFTAGVTDVMMDPDVPSGIISVFVTINALSVSETL